MAVTLKSTKAKIRDPKKVRGVLYAYEWEGVEIELREEDSGWTLEMAYSDKDQDSFQLPLALRQEQLPSEEQYANEDAYFDAELEVFLDKGEEGFLALLRELAVHLETPLLILHAKASPLDGFNYGATVWRVQPGAQEVETLEV